MPTRFDPNHPLRQDALAEALRLSGEVAAASRAYNAHHRRFPQVKVRVIEPFRLGIDAGFAPSRWALADEIVELPGDLAAWLCSERAGRRAEKVG